MASNGRSENVPVSFSSCFGVEREAIEQYGAIDISLVNDLPLFIDPFLLFNSEDEGLRKIHGEMIRYIIFLRNEVERHSSFDEGMLKAWFLFSEVKQTWLGFSKTGNSGRGLGPGFAKGLYENLGKAFRDFGEEELLRSPHIEKLCLINPSVGKDGISDFTTNFAKGFLAEYTQAFAKEHIAEKKLATVVVPKARFNYETKSWMPLECRLPVFNGDYVLLTPRRILTRDDTFINRRDMLEGIGRIAPSIGNEALRFELNEFLARVLADDSVRKKERKTLMRITATVCFFSRLRPFCFIFCLLRYHRLPLWHSKAEPPGDRPRTGPGTGRPRRQYRSADTGPPAPCPERRRKRTGPCPPPVFRKPAEWC